VILYAVFTTSAVFAVNLCPSIHFSVTSWEFYEGCLNIGSCKKRPGNLFSDAKDLHEISTGPASRGGVWYSHDFWPISRYISETVQHRDIVTMER